MDLNGLRKRFSYHFYKKKYCIIDGLSGYSRDLVHCCKPAINYLFKSRFSGDLHDLYYN